MDTCNTETVIDKAHIFLLNLNSMQILALNMYLRAWKVIEPISYMHFSKTKVSREQFKFHIDDIILYSPGFFWFFFGGNRFFIRCTRKLKNIVFPFSMQ